MCIKFLKDDI